MTHKAAAWIYGQLIDLAVGSFVEIHINKKEGSINTVLAWRGNAGSIRSKDYMMSLQLK